MDRLTSNNGFTLVEVSVFILLLSLFTLFYLPVSAMKDTSYYLFIDEYLYTQSKAMTETKSYQLDAAGKTIHFNEKGNVWNADTLHFHQHKIIVELGGGRLVEKQ